MKRFILFIVLTMLVGCASGKPYLPDDFTLTPAQCRVHGVDVPDELQITGQIVGQYSTNYTGVERACGQIQAGCAKPIGDHTYEIYYAGAKRFCLAEHEWCHAAYEYPHHGGWFMLAVQRGDVWAHCGPEQPNKFTAWLYSAKNK